MRVKIVSVKDKQGNELKDKLHADTVGKCGEVQRLEVGTPMVIRMDRLPGEEDYAFLRTSATNEINYRGNDITVNTSHSVYRLEVVER